MVGLPLALALLLAASAYGSNPLFARHGCGCLSNPIAAQLTATEISNLRVYARERGLKHYLALTDNAIQGIFRYNLMNNYPDIVPSSRSGVLQVMQDSLSTLTDAMVPSVSHCGKIASYLQKSVPQLASGSVNMDLRALVASSSIVLHQRGVKVNLEQLNTLLKTGLMAYLQSTAYESSYSTLAKLIAALDHIDHNLPNILDQDSLLVVRRALENRFNLNREIFDKRYELAIKTFELNRRRLLASFNSLAYRGPKYEVNVQLVIKEMLTLFPGITPKTVRTVLNILQLTNSAGGKATPMDLLAMITVPKLDASLHSINDRYANRIFLKLPSRHRGLTIGHVREAFHLFVIGLMSQGVQPLNLQATYEAFIWHTRRFFLSAQQYTAETYFLHVIRAVVPAIPRGSAAFRLRIFDKSVVINNILVPKPMKSIYKKGRKSIIGRIRGLQGSSNDITNRLERSGGEKGHIGNIVSMKPTIVAANTPGYDRFEYQKVIMSAYHLKQIANVLVQRFNRLKEPALQIPLLHILVRANVIRGTGERAAAAFRRLFQGLEPYSAPSNLGYIITQLSEHRLQLTEDQLLAGLQQFYVASRCLGYHIPEKSIPSMFMYAIRQYLSGLPSVPAQPFNDKFMQFLDMRLAAIMKQVTVIDHQVPIDDYITQKIFSVFRGPRISVNARRTITRFIHTSKLLPKSVQGLSVVAQYQNLLKSLFKRYPLRVFILGVQDLTKIRAQLAKVGIKVSIKYLRDANVMAYIGLGLLNKFPGPINVVRIHDVVYRSIRYFLRVNKVSNIPTVKFFHFLLQLYKVPTPQLPVPKAPIYQTVHTPAPIYILPGINLPVKQVQRLIAILRARFVFVSIQNVQSILAHTILILRGNGKRVVQRNCFKYLYGYYKVLPKNIAIGAFDIEPLLEKIDAQLVDATISGTGIQSALVELNIHMHSLRLPVPSVEMRNKFLSFVLGAYGKDQVRRQLPFGRLFYEFLKGFLPKLPSYLKPFPLFAGPQISSVLYSKLKTPIYPSDIPLYLQAVRRVKIDSLTIGSLQNTLSSISLLPSLQPAEVTSVLDFAREKKIKVTKLEVIRAFAICRLSVGLSSVKISRVQLIRIFQQVMFSIVRKYSRLLVVSYVKQILVRIKSFRRPIRPFKPIKPFKFRCDGKRFNC